MSNVVETVVAETPVKKVKKTKTVSTDAVPKKTRKPKAVVEPVVPAVTETEVVAVVKRQKKVKLDPPSSESCGLNIPLAKVKGIMNNVVNKDVKRITGELSAFKDEGAAVFSLDLLAPETRAYVLQCYEEYVQEHASERRTQYESDFVNAMSEEQKVSYFANKGQAAMSGTYTTDEVFNLSYNSNFYAGFNERLVEFSTETVDEAGVKTKTSSWVELTALTPLQQVQFYIQLVKKNKLRFSYRIEFNPSALIEDAMKQMIDNATSQCLADGKNTIALQHALSIPEYGKYSLFSLISNLRTYREALASYEEFMNSEPRLTEDGKKVKVNDFLVESLARTKQRLNFGIDSQFEKFINELCREVRFEKLGDDKTGNRISNVSGAFRVFGTNLVVELIHVISQVLKAEVMSRNIKTINDVIINTTIANMLHIHGASSEIDHAFESYKSRFELNQKFSVSKKEENLQKKTAKAAAAVVAETASVEEVVPSA